MKLVKMSIRRPVTVTMLMVTLVLFGAVAYQRLPINLLPDISYPTLSVRTEFVGAAPEEVENLVTRRIEESVSVVNKVIRISSRSRPGLSDVTVEFEWGVQMDFASLEVREKLDRLRLPQEVDSPVILRYDPSLEPIMRLGLTSAEIDLIALRTMAEERLKNRLETIDGVAAIEVSGGLEEEIHVSLNESQLASLGLTVSQVASRVAAENVNLTGGTLTDGEADYLVRTLNQYKTPGEIADIIIVRRGQALIRLSDFATVTRSFKDRTIITEVNGSENVELAVFKEADANTILVARRVHERLEEIRRDYGASSGIKLAVITDQSRFIEQSITEVLKTAIIGGILAVIILFVFLQRIGATVIIGMAIPICVIATFFFMYISGVSLNIMSLGGLALGVGMLVDNSIVVLESIDRYLRQGHSPPEAADEGASLVGKAVTASTMTTICVFLPIIFVTGVAGQLFTDQSLTVTYSLLVSLLVALTLIPMMSSGFRGGQSFGSGQQHSAPEGGENPAPEHGPRPGPRWIYYPVDAVVGILKAVFYWLPFALLTIVKWVGLIIGWIIKGLISPLLYLYGRLYGKVESSYERLLPWVLAHRLQTIGLALLMFVSAVAIFPRLGMELIPEMSQNEIQVGLKMPVGTPVERTRDALARMQRITMQEPEVKLVYISAGLSSMTGGGLKEEREDIGQMNIMLSGNLGREQEDELIERLREQFELIPGTSVKFGRPVLYTYKTPVELEIKGYNLATLDRISDEVAERMRTIEGLSDIKSSTEGGNPEIQIYFRRDRLASLGLGLSQMAGAVRGKVLGEVPTELHKLGRQVDIRVRVEEEDRDRLEDIRNLTVARVGGRPITLEAVADLKVEQGPSEIRRVDQERVAVVSAGLAGIDLGAAIERIDYALADIAVPPEISLSIGGQGLEMSRSMDSMIFAICLAVFLVYLVMASQFESLLHPLVILFTIPFGLIGVIWSLYVTSGVISVVALIGVVMLSGIVVNNAIVLVDYVNVLRRQGKSKHEALTEAGNARLKPILMTTATTVLGLLPMAIGLGEGSEVRAPMAVVVIGGLLVGTFMTLLLLPTVYSLFDWRD
ncbi:MAG: efflux RND transporter permease subunit [Candidatus Glassbacteria bacterium]|nr:efflux RND transporter permease subunit [Candidatus Glassbacteria bacterium]